MSDTTSTAGIAELANSGNGETAPAPAPETKTEGKRGRKPLPEVDLNTINFNNIASSIGPLMVKINQLDVTKFNENKTVISRLLNVINGLENVVDIATKINNGEVVPSTRGRKSLAETNPDEARKKAAFATFETIERFDKQFGVNPVLNQTIAEQFSAKWDGKNLEDYRTEYNAEKEKRAAEAKAKREAKKSETADPNKPKGKRGRPKKTEIAAEPQQDVESPLNSVINRE